MSRWKKYIVGFVALLLFMFAALLVVAKIMITPERVREALVPMVENNLQRNLQFDDIEISLFSGIVLTELVLSERESDERFITVEKAVLNYRLWPLFLLKVDVDELLLERPKVHVIRSRDGTFNFSDMSVPSKTSGVQTPIQDPGTKVSPVALTISKIMINNGEMVFDDLGSAEPIRHEVSALNLILRNFSLTEPFQASFSTVWNGNDLALDGTFNLDGLSADTSARVNAIQFELKGALVETETTRLRAVIRLQPIEISALLKSIPKEFLSSPETMNMSGRVSAEVSLDGLVSAPESMLSRGRIDLQNIATETQFTRNSLNGSVLLERKSLKTENLSLKLNDQIIDVFVETDNYLRQPLKADFMMSSSRIDLDKFIPDEKVAPQSAPPSDNNRHPDEIGPYQLPLDLNGRIEIGQLLYHGLPMEHFAARLALKDNILSIKSLTAKVSGGGFEQTGEVNLGVQGLQYNMRSKIQNVNLTPVVTALKKEFAQNVSGVLNGNVEMSGAGMSETSIKKNVVGNGQFTLQKTTLTSLPTLDAASVLLGMPELKEIVIDDGLLDFSIKQSLVSLNLISNGPQMKQKATGTVSLDGYLGLNIEFLLSPQLSKKLDNKGVLRNVLVGRDGWSTIPLKIKGPHSAPNVSLDMQRLKKQAAQGAIDSLADRLLKKSGKDKESDPQQGAEQSRKLIDEALKELFGN